MKGEKQIYRYAKGQPDARPTPEFPLKNKRLSEETGAHLHVNANSIEVGSNRRLSPSNPKARV